MTGRWDVVLVSDRVRATDLDGCVRTHPPIPTRVELTSGLWVGPIDRDLTNLILAECSRDRVRGGALYGFVLEDPSGLEWDPADDLANAVGLSHLIRGTETGFEYAATVRFVEHEAPRVERAPILTPYLKAWCSDERHRRWLCQDDALLLRDLIAKHKELRPALKGSKTGRAIRDFNQTPYLYNSVVRPSLSPAS
jgi:hypothetical protein